MDTKKHQGLKIGDSLYQGELYILIDDNTKKLFIESDSTLDTWDSPEEALADCKESKYTRTTTQFSNDTTARYATWEEVLAVEWDKYVLNTGS